MGVNLRAGEKPLTGRARVPARRERVLEANGVFRFVDPGKLWASGTTDREDAIPPRCGPTAPGRHPSRRACVSQASREPSAASEPTPVGHS
jgi:hypothetical protein